MISLQLNKSSVQCGQLNYLISKCIILSFLILIPGTLLSLWAQNNIKSTYRRYARVRSQIGMSAQVAQTILSNMGITDIKVERVRELTDHFFM